MQHAPKIYIKILKIPAPNNGIIQTVKPECLSFTSEDSYKLVTIGRLDT